MNAKIAELKIAELSWPGAVSADRGPATRIALTARRVVPRQMFAQILSSHPRLRAPRLATFRVIGMRAYGGQPVVSSEIVRSDGSRVQIDWHLVDQQGRYEVSDVVIGGYSMEVTQRNDFAQWIQNDGGRFDALLAIMRQQIAQAG